MLKGFRYPLNSAGKSTFNPLPPWGFKMCPTQ